jgi:hypothetical protein
MNRTCRLEQRIKLVTLLIMAALVLSGATAIPLTSEIDWLVKFTNPQGLSGAKLAPSGLALRLMKAQEALHQTKAVYPFLFYGTDWLAFGHFMIALAFIGVLLDPLRNARLFTFGIIACVLVIPYALVFGALCGIPSGGAWSIAPWVCSALFPCGSPEGGCENWRSDRRLIQAPVDHG